MRALSSSSSLEAAPKEAKNLQEDEKVTAAAVDEYVDSAVEDQLDSVLSGAQREEVIQEALKSSSVTPPEEQIDSAVEDEVREALSAVDLLDDGGRHRSELVEEEVEEDRHPWPEWDKFLNMLEVGGHFVFESETTDRRAVVRQEDDSGKIKRASMAFARNRDDVIKYISTTRILFYTAKSGFTNSGVSLKTLQVT